MDTIRFDDDTVAYLREEFCSLSWKYFKENTIQIVEKIDINLSGNIDVVVNIGIDDSYCFSYLMEDLINSCNTAMIMSNYMGSYSLSVTGIDDVLVGIYGEFQGNINIDL